MLPLQRATSLPVRPVKVQPGWTPQQQAIAATYNRLGGLFELLAERVGITAAAALAVFFVESSGIALRPGLAILRFETHHFWNSWGSRNCTAFDEHFEFGGHNGVPGREWQGHAFSLAAGGPFVPVHDGRQTTEYAALNLAMHLAGEEAAVRSVSLGGCQIMVSNFAMLGYSSASAMYHAFQTNENAHVLGFFDFCAHQPAPHPGQLIQHLQHSDFSQFAIYYNGDSRGLYRQKLCAATSDAELVLEKEQTA